MHNTRLFFISGLVIGFSLWLPQFAAAAGCDDEPDQADPEPEQPIIYSTAVQLNEILPNPSGEETHDEFIELYNSSDQAVDVTGWLLSDATAKTYALEGTIDALGYQVIYREHSGIALNNSGDLVELLYPNNEVADTMEYDESAEPDMSLARDESAEWVWTTILTPGRTNVFETVDNDDDDDPEQDDSESDDTTDDPVDQEEPVDEPEPDFSNDIQLSELLPDPEGSDSTDEWIELYNAGDRSVNLFNWQLTDGSRVFTFDETNEIAGNGYIVVNVENSKISLNNSGETISVFDPNAELIDAVTYDEAPTGESYARFPDKTDEWAWTDQLSPGETNIPASSTEDDESPEPDLDSPVSSPSPNENQNETPTEDAAQTALTIQAAKQLSSGESVEIEGVVNVLPDLFGSQYFYVQDDTGGIQIYSYKKDFPDLAVGDRVRIIGHTSIVDGEIKINTAQAADIVVIANGEDIMPRLLSEYDEAAAGTLVSVSGQVTEKSGSTVVLQSAAPSVDNENTVIEAGQPAVAWNVYLKRGTGLKISLFNDGDDMTVVGVLTNSNDGIRVQPRGLADIGQAEADLANDEGAKVSGVTASLVQPAQALSNSTYQLAESGETQKPIRAVIWIVVLIGVVASLALLSRSEQLRTLVRNRIVAWAHAQAVQSHHSVAARKSTRD